MQWFETRHRLADIEQETSRRLAEADAARKEDRGALKQMREQVDGLQGKLGAADARLAEYQAQSDALQALYQDLARGREESGVLEAEQAITLAAQQLQLAGNVPAAIAALRAAEARLARVDRPQLLPLRKALAADLERLAALRGRPGRGQCAAGADSADRRQAAAGHGCPAAGIPREAGRGGAVAVVEAHRGRGLAGAEGARPHPALRPRGGGAVGLTALFVAGIVVVQQRDKSKDPNGLVRVTETVEAYRVRVISRPERREKSWRMSGEILAVKSSAGWMTCRGKLLLYWPTEERADTLRYGDVLLVTGSPRTIDGPQNPDEFDYKAFLAHRQIFHQHYVRAGQWLTEARTARRAPIYYATEARRCTLEVINRIVQGDRERAIVAAFVIGVTDGIDDDLKKAYCAGGAMHALAVSGMHVSILYGVLLFLLKPMERRRAGKWTVAILSLSLLWMYGFVTGLTPSVLRAVTMFSYSPKGLLITTRIAQKMVYND